MHVSYLNNSKAPDVFEITLEHVKLAAPIFFNIIMCLTNDVLTHGRLPDTYKVGRVNPVTKKESPEKQKANYRWITITSIVGKVVELHMMTHSGPPLDLNQSRLQFSFTVSCSPVLPALVLTEVIAEAIDNNEQLLITFMDTSKAFDVVSHKGMLNSLHQQEVRGTLLITYDSMYTNIRSVVKWQDELSSPFSEGQGICHGGNS